MNDTYAVVNKPKQPLSPQTSPIYSTVTKATDRSRTLPVSHHYDNVPQDPSAPPVYSTVKPRDKKLSLPLLATPIYDIAQPTSHRRKEGSENHLVAAERLSAAAADDDDYEDVSSSDTASLCSVGGLGFNCRIQKPRGPRDPPAEWSRLER